MNKNDLFFGFVSAPIHFYKIKKWEDFSDEEKIEYIKAEKREKLNRLLGSIKEIFLLSSFLFFLSIGFCIIFKFIMLI